MGGAEPKHLVHKNVLKTVIEDLPGRGRCLDDWRGEGSVNCLEFLLLLEEIGRGGPVWARYGHGPGSTSYGPLLPPPCTLKVSLMYRLPFVSKIDACRVSGSSILLKMCKF